MPITAAMIAPHPPLMVPEVGQGREREIGRTVDSCRKAARFLAGSRPDTLIVISPHALSYQDYFHMPSGAVLRGDLKAFGGTAAIEARLDEELIREIEQRCREDGFPAGTEGEMFEAMDHATYIPLYYLNKEITDYRLVVCSLSGLSREETYRFGIYVREAADALGRRAAVIASGDLSHKLKESGPYRYAPEGPLLDSALTGIMKSGDLEAFLEVEERLSRLGADCGLGAFIMMAGMLHQSAVTPEFLSYEGPFGVGYAVCLFRPVPSRTHPDGYIKLARESLEYYVRHDRLMPVPQDLPAQMLETAAGAFVSLHKGGSLRGCIGTITATQEHVALEVMHNAISAGIRDPRFMRVTADELSSLEYSVDILMPAEPVTDRSLLDCKRFGIIVTKGNRRGLLLPDLEGVDTVAAQIEIACMKAGIDPAADFTLERFEVIRHS